MAGYQKRTKQFSVADYLMRTLIAWVAAWLPVWILFDSCGVDIPLALLPVSAIPALVLKMLSYRSARTRNIARIAVVAAVVAAALIGREATLSGFHRCFDALAEAINNYYHTGIELYEDASVSEVGLLLLLLLPTVALLIMSDSATEGHTWIPWLAVSFLFPWVAILVDAFCPIIFFCIYAGLVVYFLMTGESYGLRVTAGVRFRVITAGLIAGMLLVSCLIVTDDLYDSKLRDWKGRLVIGNYLSEHFPMLFGHSVNGPDTSDVFGLSGGRLPKSGRLQYSTQVVGTVTLPKDYGMLYLRTGAYGVYAGTQWNAVDGFHYEEGDRSFLTMAELPTRLEKYYTEYQGAPADRVHFVLNRASIDVYMYRLDGYVPLPYHSVYPELSEVKLTAEGYPVFRTSREHRYTVMCYYNWTRLPASAAYAKSQYDLGITDLPIDRDIAQVLGEYRNYVYANYLTIPDSCSRVKGMLPARSGESVMESVLRVQNFLNNGYAYTTRPGELPEGEDFIEYFLMENKKGYCAYFASAAVMLFRSLGIPARYVEGYAIEGGIVASSPKVGSRTVMEHKVDGSVGISSEDYVMVELTDQFAHAWVEIFLDGYGWYPVEVTNSSAEYEFASVVEYFNNKIGEGNPTPKPTLTPGKPDVTPTPSVTKPPKATVTPGGATPTPNPDNGKKSTPSPGENRSGDDREDNPLRLLRVLLVLVLIAVPVAVIGIRYTHKQRIRRKYEYRSDVNKAFIYVCRDIGRALRLRGLAYVRCEADSAYIGRAKEAYGHAEELDWLLSAGNRAAYSGEQLTEEDRKRAIRLYRSIRREALAEAGLLRRVVLTYFKVI